MSVPLLLEKYSEIFLHGLVEKLICFVMKIKTVEPAVVCCFSVVSKSSQVEGKQPAAISGCYLNHICSLVLHMFCCDAQE